MLKFFTYAFLTTHVFSNCTDCSPITERSLSKSSLSKSPLSKSHLGSSVSGRSSSNIFNKMTCNQNCDYDDFKFVEIRVSEYGNNPSRFKYLYNITEDDGISIYMNNDICGFHCDNLNHIGYSYNDKYFEIDYIDFEDDIINVSNCSTLYLNSSVNNYDCYSEYLNTTLEEYNMNSTNNFNTSSSTSSSTTSDTSISTTSDTSISTNSSTTTSNTTTTIIDNNASTNISDNSKVNNKNSQTLIIIGGSVFGFACIMLILFFIRRNEVDKVDTNVNTEHEYLEPTLLRNRDKEYNNTDYNATNYDQLQDTTKNIKQTVYSEIKDTNNRESGNEEELYDLASDYMAVEGKTIEKPLYSEVTKTHQYETASGKTFNVINYELADNTIDEPDYQLASNLSINNAQDQHLYDMADTKEMVNNIKVNTDLHDHVNDFADKNNISVVNNDK